MVSLVPYAAKYEAETCLRMSHFFGFHHALNGEASSTSCDTEIQDTLNEWLKSPSELYVILENNTSVGFLRVGYRGPEVAWIEDVFVDAQCRGNGIASRAIGVAEELVRTHPGYVAICMDVVPRNEAALRLYSRLGYTDISLITLRKEFSGEKRSRKETFLGHDFTY